MVPAKDETLPVMCFLGKYKPVPVGVMAPIPNASKREGVSSTEIHVAAE